MHKLYKLQDELCQALETMAERGVSEQTLPTIDKLAHAAKCVATLMEKEEGGQSFRRSYDRGSYDGGSYDRGSYDGGSMRSYRGGSYDGSYDGSYAGNSYRRRDSMGRYSREGAEDLAEQIKGMMRDIPDDARGAAEKLIQKLEG